MNLLASCLALVAFLLAVAFAAAGGKAPAEPSAQDVRNSTITISSPLPPPPQPPWPHHPMQKILCLEWAKPSVVAAQVAAAIPLSGGTSMICCDRSGGMVILVEEDLAELQFVAYLAGALDVPPPPLA